MKLPPELIERMQRATKLAGDLGMATKWHETAVKALTRRCEVIEALAGHKLEQAGSERLGLVEEGK